MGNMPNTIYQFAMSRQTLACLSPGSGANPVTFTVLALNVIARYIGARERVINHGRDVSHCHTNAYQTEKKDTPMTDTAIKTPKTKSVFTEESTAVNTKTTQPPVSAPVINTQANTQTQTGASSTTEEATPAAKEMQIRDLNFHYGDFHALKNISIDIPDRKVTAFIGPSGCGKSTLLRTFNRMYDLYPNMRADGQIILDGQNILDKSVDVNLLRARVGMVFQKPTPFPMSIFDNVAFGVRLYEKLSQSGSGRTCRMGT